MTGAPCCSSPSSQTRRASLCPSPPTRARLQRLSVLSSALSSRPSRCAATGTSHSRTSRYTSAPSPSLQATSGSVSPSSTPRVAAVQWAGLQEALRLPDRRLLQKGKSRWRGRMCSMSRPARGRVARSYVGLPWAFLCMGSRSWSRRGRWVRPWPKARPYGPAEGACYRPWKNFTVSGYDV